MDPSETICDNTDAKEDAETSCSKCKQPVKSRSCHRLHWAGCKPDFATDLELHVTNLINDAVLTITNKFTCETNNLLTLINTLNSDITNLREENKILNNKLDSLFNGANSNIGSRDTCPAIATNLSTQSNSDLTCTTSSPSAAGLNQIVLPSTNPSNYAGKLKQNKSVVIVTPKENQPAEATDRHVRNSIKNVKYNVAGIKHGLQGRVFINCADEHSLEGIKTAATKELGSGYKVSIPTAKLPRIKILNIKDDLSKEQIYEYLITQNKNIDKHSDLKVLHISKVANNDYGAKFVAYIEVNGMCFSKLMKDSYVNIGWDKCRIFEDLKITRCFNCNGFSHKSDRCMNNTSCGKCAGAHNSKNCNSDILKCSNCVYAATTLNKRDIDVMHPAWDRNCPSYGRLLKIAQSRINYLES